MTDENVVNMSEVKREDALETPLTALKNIVEQIEGGEIDEPQRMVLTLDDGNNVEVFGSGERGDAIESLGLLEAGKCQIFHCMRGD